MRIRFLLLSLLFLVLQMNAQQSETIPCAFDEYKQKMLTLHPELEAIQDERNAKLKAKIKKKKEGLLRSSEYGEMVIPVVVHVINSPDYPNVDISYSQIESQIQAMNDAFQNNVPASSIRFCLAKSSYLLTPSSTPWTDINEPGVMRYNGGALSDNTMSASVNTQLVNLTHPSGNNLFPFDRYLNVWVVNSISAVGISGTILGYAPYPITGTAFGNIDGVIIRSDIFGSNAYGGSFNLFPDYPNGTTMTHEVGHYLELLHTFENGGCAGWGVLADEDQGDLVPDTKAVPEPPYTISICDDFAACDGTFNEVTDNYMFYSKGYCKSRFSEGQLTRMETFIEEYRSALVEYENLIAAGLVEPSGCVEPILSACFEASTPRCLDEPIDFSTTISGTNNSAVSWLWEMGEGTQLTDPESTSFTYTTPGFYNVTLTVTDGSGASLSETIEIAVNACDLENPSQSNWFFGRFCGLDFSSGGPIVSDEAYVANGSNAINTQEAALTQNDQNGNLLFYGQADKLWDRNHVEYPLITGLTQPNSTSQIISVPNPSNENQYYVFIPPTGNTTWGNPLMPLQYLLVEVLADGSLIVPSTFETVSINEGRIAEMITAVPHCNGKDYWVIFHIVNHTNSGFLDLSQMAVLRISEFGVTNATFDLGAFDIYPGLDQNGNPKYFPFTEYVSGQLKASPDRQRLAMAGHGSGTNGGLVTFLFNDATGEVNFGDVIITTPVEGVSFSPNSQYIFAAHRDPSYDVYRYDISGANGIEIFDGMDDPDNKQGRMQIGPDGVIYCTTKAILKRLSAIPFPNDPIAPGYSVNLIPFSSIGGNAGPRTSLPNMIDAIPLEEPLLPDFTTSNIACTEVEMNIDDCWVGYQVQWDFGDGTIIGPSNQDDVPTGNTSGTFATPIHTYTATGNYEVTMRLFVDGQPISCPSATHTVSVDIGSGFVINGPDEICEGLLMNYSVFGLVGFTYEWTIQGGAFANGVTVFQGTTAPVVWSPGIGTINVIAYPPNSSCPNQTASMDVTVLAEPCDVDPCEVVIAQSCLEGSNVLLSLLTADGDLVPINSLTDIIWNFGTTTISNENPISVPEAMIDGTVTFTSSTCEQVVLEWTSITCCGADIIGDIAANETWVNETLLIDEEVVVENGEVLTILNSYLGFTEIGYIKVEDGGSLKINNSTLTADEFCGGLTWPGIRLYGTGKVQIRKSLLEKAKNGIYSTEGVGLVVDAQKNQFLNNEISIRIEKGKDKIGFKIWNNTFGTQGVTTQAIRFYAIILDGEPTTSIDRNRFYNPTYGIWASDLDNGDLQIYKNLFSGMTEWGIFYRNTNVTGNQISNTSPYRIRDNTFRGVAKGIHVQKTNIGDIRNNSLSDIGVIGIRLNNILGYEVRQNRIHSIISNPNWSVGILINESEYVDNYNPTYQYIEENTTRDFKYGVMFRNYTTYNHKLSFNCNRMENHKIGLLLNTNASFGNVSYLHTLGGAQSPVYNRFMNTDYDIHVYNQASTTNTFDGYYGPDCAFGCQEYQPEITGNGIYPPPVYVSVNITSIPCWSPIVIRENWNDNLTLDAVLSPNPSSDYTVLELKGITLDEKVHIRLFDLSGQLIKTIQEGNISSTQFAVRTSTLPEGMYLVQIQSEKEMITKKLVITH